MTSDKNKANKVNLHHAKVFLGVVSEAVAEASKDGEMTASDLHIIGECLNIAGAYIKKAEPTDGDQG